MTALDNLPTNKNFLSPLGWTLLIKRAPNVVFFLQQVELPNIALSSPDFANPFVKYPTPGDHIEFAPLNLTFKIDEDMQNWLEIFTWLMQLGFPTSYQEYAQVQAIPLITGLGIRSDLTLLIHSAAHNPKWEIVFRDAFPVALSGRQPFTSTDPDVNYMIASTTFKYTSYSVRSVSDPVPPDGFTT